MSVLLKYLTDEFANKRLIIFAHLMRLNKWARCPQLWTLVHVHATCNSLHNWVYVPFYHLSWDTPANHVNV